VTTSSAPITPDEARRIARKTIFDAWKEEYELRYADDIAAASTLAEKEELRAELAAILDSHHFAYGDYFIEDIEYNRYNEDYPDEQDPYYDGNGDPIPFDAIVAQSLTWDDGQGLGFYFAYDKRTGEIIDQTETTD
jgi:hypothetical protein